jgi:hypothetical protein
MKTDKHKATAVFSTVDGETLRVSYDNRGEPYREGAGFTYEGGRDHTFHFMLEHRELVELRDVIDRILGKDRK